ncbi:hypothetical protein E3U43_017428 [Larimichthys crocea]|uniref:Uncharacterized protein n=1 Tax=Larimichthys crocea TaxID=215358 RepID=A0ACD3QZB1_LARCR|nr:hypothetical protein E3U43_017428 [Larimichthys crocea]
MSQNDPIPVHHYKTLKSINHHCLKEKPGSNGRPTPIEHFITERREKARDEERDHSQKSPLWKICGQTEGEKQEGRKRKHLEKVEDGVSMLALSGGDGICVRTRVWVGVLGQLHLQRPEQQGKDTGLYSLLHVCDPD